VPGRGRVRRWHLAEGRGATVKSRDRGARANARRDHQVLTARHAWGRG
jgi:hypothetical protein